MAEVSGGRVDAAGSGDPVLLAGAGLEPLRARLARGRRVITVELPAGGPARDRAGVLGAAAAAAGLERYALVGGGGAAAAALWHAIDAPGAVATLVLLAPDAAGGTDEAPAAGAAGLPPGAELETAMAGCDVPTLVLVGDRDEPARGRVYKAALPRCVFGIVYRAGPELVADRPDAVAEWVGDFLDRGLAFAVTTRSALLHR